MKWDDSCHENTPLVQYEFTSILTAIQSKARILKEEANKRLSYGGGSEKVEVPEVKLQAQADLKTRDWQIAIDEAREQSDATGVYTDGCITENGVVGAGWYVE